ncbi:hypothetical protein CCMA1212_002737 [Trichoderma ghanense]|uniref:Reverse transcriptase RNase H-like domain-containing protein n=1 Tax=Trichoderma ghanense TaxID=65468 RepID=A0ABY2H975_9HYPO
MYTKVLKAPDEVTNDDVEGDLEDTEENDVEEVGEAASWQTASSRTSLANIIEQCASRTIRTKERKLKHDCLEQDYLQHVDGSKERGFGAALHQMQDGRLRPIVFLSRCLSQAEQGCGSTELETAALVWALQKLSHFLDHSHITVVTDHTAIKGTFQAVGSQQPKGIPPRHPSAEIPAPRWMMTTYRLPKMTGLLYPRRDFLVGVLSTSAGVVKQDERRLR